MSWNNGNVILTEIIQILKRTITEYETRVEIYKDLIEFFESNDCDTLFECLDEDRAYDDAYFELHPDKDDLEASENWNEYDEN